MRKALLWLWQLPQHLLGLAVWKVLKLAGKVVSTVESHDNAIIFVDVQIGLSLGKYIFICKSYGGNTIKHEQGHSVQSRRLGPLYLLIIGLPSFTGNIYSRITHKNSAWYYRQPWEAQADKLGGVRR